MCQQQVGHIQAPQHQPKTISSAGQIVQQQIAQQQEPTTPTENQASSTQQSTASSIQPLETASPELDKENKIEVKEEEVESKEIVIEKVEDKEVEDA